MAQKRQYQTQPPPPPPPQGPSILDLAGTLSNPGFREFITGLTSGAANAGLGAGQSVVNGVIMDNVLGQGVATAMPNAGGGFLSSMGGMGVLGPAAVGAVALPGLMDVFFGESKTKFREPKRRAALGQRMDLSKIPEANKEFNVNRGSRGRDMLGYSAPYELFGTDDDPAKLEALADQLIDSGAVSNYKGTVNIGRGDTFGRKTGRWSADALERDREKKRSMAQQYGEIARMAQDSGVSIDEEGFKRKLAKLSQSGLREHSGEGAGGPFGDLGGLVKQAMAEKINAKKGIKTEPRVDSDLMDAFTAAMGRGGSSSNSSRPPVPGAKPDSGNTSLMPPKGEIRDAMYVVGRDGPPRNLNISGVLKEATEQSVRKPSWLDLLGRGR